MVLKAVLSELDIPNLNLSSRFNRNPTPSVNSTPNYASAQGGTNFYNYSQSPTNSLTEVQAQALIDGLGTVIAQAGATFNNDPAFATLFTESTVIGLDDQFTGQANSEAKVLANFTVGAEQTLSFSFELNVLLKAKEIDNPKVEYNRAQSKATFLVLDTNDRSQPKVVGYFGARCNLISSQRTANFRAGGSANIRISTQGQSTDVGRNNGQDSLTGKAVGTFRQKFSSNTNITVVQINASAVELASDNLIGNLGKDVIYGTILPDNLTGTFGADAIYASLGNDQVYGLTGDDTLEGGQGNDTLDGGWGDDTLYGDAGNDVLIGGRGSNVLVGGEDNDQFVFNRTNSLFSDELNVIQDFQIGSDQIVFQNWGVIDSATWLNEKFNQGKITNTSDGLLFKFDEGWNQGTLLLSGISFDQIQSQPQSIQFTEYSPIQQLSGNLLQQLSVNL